MQFKLFCSKIYQKEIRTVLNPGKIEYLKPNLLIGTGTNSIQINEIQLEGKKRIMANQFILGFPRIIGEVFG